MTRFATVFVVTGIAAALALLDAAGALPRRRHVTLPPWTDQLVIGVLPALIVLALGLAIQRTWSRRRRR